MKDISWDALKALLLVQRHGSLSGAAQALGVSVATLGRQISALEAALGVGVVRRSPQGASITPEGARIIALIKPGAERFHELGRLLPMLLLDVQRPPIRISATEAMIVEVLAPQLGQLMSQHPDIRVELETSLQLSNLNRGEADLAIRMVRPTGDTLIARRLPSIKIGLYAAASYVARSDDRLDLKAAHLLWYDRAYGDIAENIWLKAKQLESQVIFRASSVRALAIATKAGLGIAPLPAFLAKAHGLSAVSDIRLPDRKPWLVFHRDAHGNAHQKIVRAWAVQACQRALADQ